ncbi:MAG: hypothetical protein KAS23_10585 [Anaerohalosphaera sp.]|nr:hypothetical protein [Anaerohalosphaera sp.]
MRISFWKMLVTAFAGAFLFAYVYRLSEQFGAEAVSGCRLAILLSAVSGVCGMIPMAAVRAANINKRILSVFIGASARSLFVVAGIVVIELALVPSGLWFVGFVLLFYFVSLTAETYLAINLISMRAPA